MISAGSAFALCGEGHWILGGEDRSLIWSSTLTNELSKCSIGNIQIIHTPDHDKVEVVPR